VENDFIKLEQALIDSGDEEALRNFQALKENENYITRVIPSKDGRNRFTGTDDGKGGEIEYNPEHKTGGPDMTGNTDRPAFIGLGHEVGHAIDFQNGTPQFRERMNSKTASPGFQNDVERFAIKFENAVRKGYNSDPKFQRTRYY
jgi:hypothetical protein